MTPGKGIALGLLGLFCWLTGGPILLTILTILGFIVLLFLCLNYVADYIDAVIEGMTEWPDDNP